MRRGVANYLERLGIFFSEQLEPYVSGERRGKIDQARSGGVFGGIHGSLRRLFARFCTLCGPGKGRDASYN